MRWFFDAMVFFERGFLWKRILEIPLQSLNRTITRIVLFKNLVYKNVEAQILEKNKFGQLIDASYFFNFIEGEMDQPTVLPSCIDAILHFCDVPGPSW